MTKGGIKPCCHSNYYYTCNLYQLISYTLYQFSHHNIITHDEFSLLCQQNITSQQFNKAMANVAEESFTNITETYLPRYRKGEFKHLLMSKRNKSSPAQVPDKSPRIELGSNILQNFKTLHGYINNLDELFRARMSVHEEQIIQIAHSQIKKIQQQSKNIIKIYSELIHAKNISSEILDLKYEVKYYQKRACEMFEENKVLKEQIKQLRNQVTISKFEEESNYLALRNVSKKYLKEKTLRKNIQVGGLKKVLITEPTSNIKISLFDSSTGNASPQKRHFIERITATPKKQQDTVASKNEALFSSHKRKEAGQQRSLMRERIKTEPTRQILPTIKSK